MIRKQARFLFHVLLALSTTLLALPAKAQSTQPTHAHHGKQHNGPVPAFIASTAKPFPELMNEAMAVMEDGMQRAPMNGTAEHDFVTMMIPHHQGAIDMAKAVLLYSHDPELRNLAQGIITEQQNEINVMQAWLHHYQARQLNSSKTSK